jgi:hypothetical protein
MVDSKLIKPASWMWRRNRSCCSTFLERDEGLKSILAELRQAHFSPRERSSTDAFFSLDIHAGKSYAPDSLPDLLLVSVAFTRLVHVAAVIALYPKIELQADPGSRRSR